MSITIHELKLSSDRVFKYLEKQFGSEYLDSKKDMYWSIDEDIRYDPYNVPTKDNLSIGDLSWDMEELKDLVKGKTEPTANHIIWLSEVLHALADEVIAKKRL